MSAKETTTLPTQHELEGLFVNNASLQTIEAFINRFNPIRVMRMERMEIRHSAILSWLLDPQESHGLDDKFLRAFLGEALRGQSDMGYPTAIDIANADLRDADVRREWQHIDIFVHSATNNWAFVIENKFDSKQHAGQLTKYMEKIEAHFGNDETSPTVRGIFLTLYDESPEDTRYSPIVYETICEFLPRLVEQEANALSSEVTAFLKHYIDILEEALETSTEHKAMERLARQLYREHRKVLEFVMDNGTTTNFEFAVRSLVGEEPDHTVAAMIDNRPYHFDVIENEWVGFVPQSWYNAIGEDDYSFEGCEDWWLGFPVIAWLELRKDNEGAGGQIRLYAEVGPITKHAFREELIEAIQEVADEEGLKRIRFQNGAADQGRKYSKFLKNGTTMIRDVQDTDELVGGMERLLADFQPEFDAVAKVLPPFLKYGISE